MDEIIKLFTTGFIRHLLQSNGLPSLVNREEKENNDWINRKNERDIGSNHVSNNSNFKRKKL